MWYLFGMLLNGEDYGDFEAIELSNKTRFLLQTSKKAMTMIGGSASLTFRARIAYDSVFERCKIQFKVVNDKWDIQTIKYCELHNLYKCDELYIENNINIEPGWKNSVIVHKLNIAQIFMITCFKHWSPISLRSVNSIESINFYSKNNNEIQYLLVTNYVRFVCALTVDENYMKRLYTKLKLLNLLR